MKHNYIRDDNSGDHWAVGNNDLCEVLVQLQESGEQVRLRLERVVARQMGHALLRAADEAWARSQRRDQKA